MVTNVICKFTYLSSLLYKTDINYIIRFDGKTVEEAKSTTFVHSNILHLATYLGQPLTTGSYLPDHAKTEIMNLKSGKS